jgi:hypothetical protein
MIRFVRIVFFSFLLFCKNEKLLSATSNIIFLGDTITIDIDPTLQISFAENVSSTSVEIFYQKVNTANYLPLLSTLQAIKEKRKLNDWLYYQLIRRTAEQISPKAENYYRYTLYKWFLLAKSGYETTLSYNDDKLLFYVVSEDNIYDIPFFHRDGKQFICLNYHDYGSIDFTKTSIQEINTRIPEGRKSFSYIVNTMPDLKTDDYLEKQLQFQYQNKEYTFKVKLNPEVQALFKNYPVVDFQTYFNIPMSKDAYSSLIPALKQNIQHLTQQNGVDYLMQFTRQSFLFENDQAAFGIEKRLSPEQTLLYSHSDCDDRAALFFYLVKEIYDLPMIVLLYPSHVTIAIKFDKPIGKSITYNGDQYSICEPTPQAKNLSIGEINRALKHTPYEVVYAYHPIGRK